MNRNWRQIDCISVVGRHLLTIAAFALPAVPHFVSAQGMLNDGLAAPPASVQGADTDCSAYADLHTAHPGLQGKICRTIYANPSPNGQIKSAHIVGSVRQIATPANHVARVEEIQVFMDGQLKEICQVRAYVVPREMATICAVSDKSAGSIEMRVTIFRSPPPLAVASILLPAAP